MGTITVWWTLWLSGRSERDHCTTFILQQRVSFLFKKLRGRGKSLKYPFCKWVWERLSGPSEIIVGLTSWNCIRWNKTEKFKQSFEFHFFSNCDSVCLSKHQKKLKSEKVGLKQRPKIKNHLIKVRNYSWIVFGCQNEILSRNHQRSWHPNLSNNCLLNRSEH